MSVEMYYRPSCPRCQQVLNLLRDRGADPRLYDVDENPTLLKEGQRRSGHEVIPQIFVGDDCLGDSRAVLDLDRRGELSAYLVGEKD